MKFLKPNLRKVVIFIVLLVIFLNIRYPIPVVELNPVIVRGLPLFIDAPGAPEEAKSPLLKVFLIIDVIFWYLISCLIVWIYNKRKKKPA